MSCYIVETSVMQKVVNAFRMTEATFLYQALMANQGVTNG